MRIILLGPQGSGKTSISEKIAEKYAASVVKFQNVADELDTVAKEDSELGRLAKESIASGRVSDDVCTAVLKRVLGKDDLSDGFVLVGYPKYSNQASEIDDAMNRLKRPVDLVLMIDIDRDELMERRVGRIDCDHCGAHYNLYVNPPMVEGVCDECGSRVSRRPRGYEENIANQLRDYDVLLVPILEHYRLNGKLRYVDANGTEAALWRGVKRIIDATPPTIIETEPVQEAAVSLDGRLKAEAAKKASAKKKTSKQKASKKKASKKKVAKKQPVKKQPVKKQPVKKQSAKKKPLSRKKVAGNTAATKKKATAKKPTAKKKAETKKTAVKKKAVAQKGKIAKKKVTKKKVTKKAAPKKTTKKKVVKKAAVKKK